MRRAHPAPRHRGLVGDYICRAIRVHHRQGTASKRRRPRPRALRSEAIVVAYRASQPRITLADDDGRCEGRGGRFSSPNAGGQRAWHTVSHAARLVE